MHFFFILTLIELSASSLYLFKSMLPIYFAPNPGPAPDKALSKAVWYKWWGWQKLFVKSQDFLSSKIQFYREVNVFFLKSKDLIYGVKHFLMEILEHKKKLLTCTREQGEPVCRASTWKHRFGQRDSSSSPESIHY